MAKKPRPKRKTEKPEASTVVIGPDFVGYIPSTGPGINDSAYFRHQARIDEAATLLVKAIGVIWPAAASTEDLAEVLRRTADRLGRKDTARRET